MTVKSYGEERTLKTILLVDDDPLTTSMLNEKFAAENVSMTSATTAKSAKDELEKVSFAFDAVLLDLNLPDTRGEDFLEWLKLMAPEVIVIIISAEKSDDLLIRCLAKGASDFIEKPFEPDHVFQTAAQACRRKTTKETPGDMRAEIHAMDWIELTAQSQIEYLGRIQRFSEVLFNRRLPKKVVDDLRLAMEEFGRNAVEWGNKFVQEKQFRISYCFFPDRVVLKFEDEGEGFNPKAVPDPSKDPIAHLKRRQKEGKRPGGFGLFMMNRIMDEIFYNEKGNICIMTKHLPGPDDEA